MGEAHHVAGAVAPPRDPYDADIIILALDRPDETCAAIRSALEQTGIRRHLIVVDQGSRPENLQRIAATVRDRADCTLVALERNRGVAAGRNAATALGHGRVIIALDNDAEFAAPTTAAAAVAALDAAPNLGAIGFRILAWGVGADDHSSWGYPPRLRARAGEVFDAATFVGAGHAIRRTAWDAAGPYDEALFFCWEEYDWCLRVIARGWTVRYRGDIAVLHKVSQQRRVTWSSTRWFHYVPQPALHPSQAWRELARNDAPNRGLRRARPPQWAATADRARFGGRGPTRAPDGRRLSPAVRPRVSSIQRSGASQQSARPRTGRGAAHAVGGTHSGALGQSFAQQQPEYRRILHEIAPGQPLRVRPEAMQPLEPRALHPAGRARHGTGQEIEAGTDAEPEALRLARRGDGGGQPFLPWRAEGKEDEPRRVRKHESDRSGERSWIAIETHRRIVMERFGDPAAVYQGTQKRGAQADDGHALPGPQVAAEQVRGDVAPRRDTRRLKAEQSPGPGDHPRVEQAQIGVLIDAPHLRVAAEANEIVGVRSEDIAERLVGRARRDRGGGFGRVEVGQRHAEA